MLYFHDLHPYQAKAVKFLLERPQAGLWIGLGMGKTVIALTALKFLLEKQKTKKILIIAPLQVCKSVWAQEAEKWGHTKHLRFSFVLGPEKKRIAGLNAKADIYLMNRENVSWLVEYHSFSKRVWDFDTLVVDEASSFKSPKTKRFKVLKKVLKLKPRVFTLTGTPAPNSLQDLWSQIFLLDHGDRLGKSFYGFQNAFFDSDFFGYHFTPKPFAKEKIYSLLEGLILTLKSQDYLDLPKVLNITKFCNLNAKALKQYKDIEKNLLLEFKGKKIEVLNAANLANKLLQISNGFVYDEHQKPLEIHDEKFKVLKDLVEDNPDENFLVAYNFKYDLARLKKWFPQAVVLKEDSQSVDLWNRGRIKILLAHPASAGHGLNLQYGGSTIVWFGLNWSLELTEQFNGRIIRQGQKRQVKIVSLIAKGCIDERIIKIVQSKGLNQNALLDALKI